ncbi:MAG: hypothetical protein KGH75_03130 [Rhodospirillales bacterium]|nr:hypothetical protein [Rhodospirillales bacterium]
MIKQVVADLNKTQKKTVRKWTTKNNPYKTVTRPISDHVFGSKTRHILPNSIEEHEGEPHYQVTDWLDKNEYDPHKLDYKKGITHHYADQSRKRPQKIGKVLEKTNAPDYVKKSYMNDPYRVATKATHLQTTISRHPFDVAGMSTDRGWSSCMDMTSGANRSFLHKDLENGTHVAYLHHKDDPTISHPVARIALKPYEHKGEKTILRPEAKTYGMSNPAFHKQVKNWSEKNFPAKPNVVYTKNKHVYDDDEHLTGTSKHILHHTDNSVYSKNSTKELDNIASDNKLKNMPVSYKEVEHHIPKEGSPFSFPHALVQHITHNLHSEDLPKLANHENPAARKSATERFNELSKHDQDKLLNDEYTSVRLGVSHNTSNIDHLKHLANDKSNLVAKNAVYSFIKQHGKNHPDWQHFRQKYHEIEK